MSYIYTQGGNARYEDINTTTKNDVDGACGRKDMPHVALLIKKGAEAHETSAVGEFRTGQSCPCEALRWAGM